MYLEKRTEDKILVTFNNEFDFQNISIENLKASSMKKDNGKTYYYVVHLIKFLANLCYGNNYLAIYSLRPLYTLSSCISISTNQLLDN